MAWACCPQKMADTPERVLRLEKIFQEENMKETLPWALGDSNLIVCVQFAKIMFSKKRAFVVPGLPRGVDWKVVRLTGRRGYSGNVVGDLVVTFDYNAGIIFDRHLREGDIQQYLRKAAEVFDEVLTVGRCVDCGNWGSHKGTCGTVIQAKVHGIEPETCPICLEITEGGVFLPCEHRFHKTCVDGIVGRDNEDVIVGTCPICRKRFIQLTEDLDDGVEGGVYLEYAAPGEV